MIVQLGVGVDEGVVVLVMDMADVHVPEKEGLKLGEAVGEELGVQLGENVRDNEGDGVSVIVNEGDNVVVLVEVGVGEGVSVVEAV